MLLDRRTFVERLGGLAAALLAAPVLAAPRARRRRRCRASRPRPPPPSPPDSAMTMSCAARGSFPPSPFDAASAPLPEQLAKLDFDCYRDIRFKSRQGAAGERGRRVPDADVPSGLPVQQPRDRERDSRRHPRPGALFGHAVRLWPQQVRAAAAGQSRLRGLSPALSAERPQGATTSSSRSWARAISASSAASSATACPRAASPSASARRKPRSSRFSGSSGSSSRSPNADRAVIYALLDGPSLTGRLPVPRLSLATRRSST